jgi:hypothetical protein
MTECSCTEAEVVRGCPIHDARTSRCNHPAPFLVGQDRKCVLEAGHAGPCDYPSYVRAYWP